MKSILYLGDVATAWNLQREIEKLKVEIQPFHAIDSTKNELQSVIHGEEKRLFGIIINIDELSNTEQEISQIIKDIIVKTDVRLCIMCPGHTIAEPFIRTMVEMGVQFFMMGANSIVNAKVIKNMLANKSNVSAIFEQTSSDNTKEKPTLPVKETKVITVGGCVSRIGVTTFCIHLIKFLQSISKKACYVDRSGTSYMGDFMLIYENEGQSDPAHSRFILEDIDFYYFTDDAAKEFARNQGYDYIVCDVGELNRDRENINLFIDSDMHILCAGSKSNEFKAVYNLLDTLHDKGVYYTFYSVPRAQRPSIAETCKSHRQKCFFTPYIDDEFVLQKNTQRMYMKMFGFTLDRSDRK